MNLFKIKYFNFKINFVTQKLNLNKHSDSHKFPDGEDCILSQLRLIRPSLLTHIRSVSDALPYSIIANLGSKHADCPIFFIITIPKFITLGQIALS